MLHHFSHSKVVGCFQCLKDFCCYSELLLPAAYCVHWGVLHIQHYYFITCCLLCALGCITHTALLFYYLLLTVCIGVYYTYSIIILLPAAYCVHWGVLHIQHYYFITCCLLCALGCITHTALLFYYLLLTVCIGVYYTYSIIILLPAAYCVHWGVLHIQHYYFITCCLLCALGCITHTALLFYYLLLTVCIGVYYTYSIIILLPAAYCVHWGVLHIQHYYFITCCLLCALGCITHTALLFYYLLLTVCIGVYYTYSIIILLPAAYCVHWGVLHIQHYYLKCTNELWDVAI